MTKKSIINKIRDYADDIEDELEGKLHDDYPNINRAMIVLWNAIEDDLKLVKDNEK